MKNIIFLFFLFLSVGAIAQTDTVPFRKANTIILVTKNTDSANFIQFQRELMKFDYSIKTSNKDLLTVSTELHELKQHPGWSYSYLFRMRFSNHRIIIKPFWKAGVSLSGMNMANDLFRWNYAKSRGNIQNMIWRDLIQVFNDFCPSCKIEYRKM